MPNQLSKGLVEVGALNVGGGGNISGIGVGTASLDLPSINADATGTATFTVTGAAAGDVVLINPDSDGFTDGLVIAQVYVSAADTVTVNVYNSTAGAVDEAATTISYVWYDRT